MPPAPSAIQPARSNVAPLPSATPGPPPGAKSRRSATGACCWGPRASPGASSRRPVAPKRRPPGPSKKQTRKHREKVPRIELRMLTFGAQK